MKYPHKQYMVLFTGMFLLLLLASCKTTPPETPPAAPPPAPAPAAPAAADPSPDQAALAALDAAVSRAEEARNRAQDFDAPVYFPSDWEDANGRYLALPEGTGRATGDEVREAVSRYDAVTAAFEELFQRSLPRYAQDREREILEARRVALEAGAEEMLPDYLILADGTALEALDQYERGDYYPAAASAALARDRYRALKTGTDAYGVRLEIEDRDFYHYDPKNFDRADGFGEAAIAAYEGENALDALENAGEALAGYTQVLTTGRETLAAERRAFSAEERRVALELKANVAVRNNFATADGIYNEAELALAAGDYDWAAGLYEEAGFRFIQTQRDTLEKRQMAEEAIKNAEEKVSESDETARKAELLLEGGVQ